MWAAARSTTARCAARNAHRTICRTAGLAGEGALPGSPPFTPRLQGQWENLDALAAGVLSGDRLALSHAITLSESRRHDHQHQAAQLLKKLQAAKPAGHSAPDDAFRIGVSGPPGAGKSSLIETLGCSMLKAGHRVAVLAIDPSSEQSGGAILGDKTRMPRLSAAADAFVRPTPARGTLGGVARATSDAAIACTAAGYDRVLVETVGVGQSETAVTDLVDCLVLVLPPVGGDELQVIKRGITEVADVLVVNKADGPLKVAAVRAAASFRGTMNFHKHSRRSWSPVVLAASAHTGSGVEKLQEALEDYHRALRASGELQELRKRQRLKLAWTATEEAVLEGLREHQAVRRLFAQLQPAIESGEVAPRNAADQLAACYIA